MAKAKLPEFIRDKVKALFGQGYDTGEVLQRIRAEAMLHLESEDGLRRCLASIRGRVKKPTEKTLPPPVPEPKPFDSGRFRAAISTLGKNAPGKDVEAACIPIAKHILRKYEGFTGIEKGPDFRGTPFDLFGFKNGNPYLIELKSSLDRFNHPGETQKWRLQELLRRNGDLRAALLQLAVRKGQYRIFYEDQLNLLFFGAKASLEPIEDWIRKRTQNPR